MKKISLVLMILSFAIGCGGGSTNTRNPDANDDNNVEIGRQIHDNTPDNNENIRHKLFFIGDSTVNFIVTSNAERGKVGWGNVMGELLKHPEDLYNRARPRSSARVYSFNPNNLPQYLKEEMKNHIDYEVNQGYYGVNRDLYWAKTKELLQRESKEGDFLLIQFGSGNDRGFYRVQNDLDGESDFKNVLKFYINQAREMGLVPIFITNPNNRAFRNNTIQNWREPYYTYTKEVAREKNVRFLDLNKKTRNEYQRLYNEAGHSCNDEINQKFGACNIHDENVDAVHFYEAGAKIVAGWVRDLACEEPESGLCSQFEGH